MTAHRVFVTGGTGYLGRALIPALLARGHRVTALVRPGSEGKLPLGCASVAGSALDAATFAAQVAPADTLVHLVGTPHPAPWKGAQFEAIDWASIQASVAAAREAGVAHLVYLSVAHPAPTMRAYWQVRERGERLIADAGLRTTFLRPWYVLGPGHRWPYALLPLYALLEHLPKTRGNARRLGLVTLRQMIAALVAAVDNPADGLRVVDVPEIRGH
jgi:uncharacterized protein YbjT (DUF2867 family)